jgi:DNA-binding CsgD family transcriptional regulator
VGETTRLWSDCDNLTERSDSISIIGYPILMTHFGAKHAIARGNRVLPISDKRAKLDPTVSGAGAVGMTNPKDARRREAASDIPTDVIQLQHLIRAILAVTADGSVTRPGNAERGSESVLVDTDLDGARYLLVRMPPADRNKLSLSPRELEIARMVAQGHPNKIIASILNISLWTVCAHVRRIFAKLGVSSRAAMVARVLEVSGAWEPPRRMLADPPAGSAVHEHSRPAVALKRLDLQDAVPARATRAVAFKAGPVRIGVNRRAV